MNRGLAALLVVACLSLTSCQFQRAADAELAQTELVGMSKSRLLQCAGAPSATAPIGNDGEILTYEYMGDRSGDEQCAYIIANCLR